MFQHSPVRQVREALALAYDSHSGQDRKSGEPYITHPVEVTRILAELHMDYESLIAGLLHDTVEDTDLVSFEEIGVRHSGPFVACLDDLLSREVDVLSGSTLSCPLSSTLLC